MTNGSALLSIVPIEIATEKLSRTRLFYNISTPRLNPLNEESDLLTVSSYRRKHAPGLNRGRYPVTLPLGQPRATMVKLSHYTNPPNPDYFSLSIPISNFVSILLSASLVLWRSAYHHAFHTKQGDEQNNAG